MFSSSSWGKMRYIISLVSYGSVMGPPTSFPNISLFQLAAFDWMELLTFWAPSCYHISKGEPNHPEVFFLGFLDTSASFTSEGVKVRSLFWKWSDATRCMQAVNSSGLPWHYQMVDIWADWATTVDCRVAERSVFWNGNVTKTFVLTTIWHSNQSFTIFPNDDPECTIQKPTIKKAE